MSHPTTQTFVDTLLKAEETGDPGPLAQLYAADSECKNLSNDEPANGVEGAKKFWGDYLKAFKSIKSHFHTVVGTDDHGVLEWVSKGELPSGKPIAYRGCSILMYEGGKVKRFHTYYDSAAFVVAPATAEAAG